MRLLHISVPDEQRDAVLDVLRERQLGYSVTEGAADQSDRTHISFVLPTDAVEHVLEDLEAEGYDREEFTVSIASEFAQFEHVDEVQDRWGDSPNKLAPAALRSKAKDLRRSPRSFLWMMILSAVVATAGIFVGSPAVVVGSMVIAPIVSPVLTANVGAVRNDRDMFVDSLHMQLIGLSVAVLASAAFAWFVRELSLVPVALSIEQMELMSIRIAPSILALVVGIAAGAAGAYGLATKGEVTLVGVMIAAALIPTAAAAGIGIAWGSRVVAVGALLLLVVSMVGVNAGAAAMLLYRGYRPDDVDAGLFEFDDLWRAATVVATLVLVVAVVGVVGLTFAEQSSFERSANDAIGDTLGEEEYRALGVRSVTYEYSAPTFTDRTLVTVTLTRTTDEEFPELPNTLADAISEETDRNAVVQVQFVDYERSDGADPEQPPSNPSGADRWRPAAGSSGNRLQGTSG